MKSILFIGASGEVTGSGYVITADNSSQVMVDFGMFQGLEEQVKQNYTSLDFDPAALQAVFLTHAHLDHSGRLPLLIYGGFEGKVYMTEPTRQLVEVILSDSARIAEKDKTRVPLYTSREVNKILDKIEVVSYDEPVATDSFMATFRDAGHILGSASIVLKEMATGKTIVFSGDLGNTPQDIVKPTAYIDHADYVVMETTYGDADHPDENAAKIIQEEINLIEENDGVLLIPAFALERTQEVLHIIHHLKRDGKVKKETPVYLDSPMGITATRIYYQYLDFCNKEIQSHSVEDDPFIFEGIVATEESIDSRNIQREPNPKVIIAGSGMMSGGRIMRHAQRFLPNDKTTVLFVGYQAEETAGREILEGAKNVLIDDIKVSVRVRVREIKILSSHADQTKLLKWLEHIKNVEKVFLVHGEEEPRKVFKGLVHEKLNISEPNILLPKNGEDLIF